MTNPTPPGQVPEALRLANALDHSVSPWSGERVMFAEAAAELRRLHAHLESEDAAHCNTISQRDEAEKLGTMLASAVAEHFRVEVGEYSNLNDPRLVALEILVGGYITDSDTDRKLAALAAGQAVAPAAQAISAEPAGAGYAELPEPYCYEFREPKERYTTDQMRAFADRTCALRVASHGQAPAQPVDFTTLGAAMRAIQQAIGLIGDPADERMQAVRRVLRGAVVVAEDSGDIPAQPDCLTCNDHGAVGNILTAEPCPDCTPTPQADSQPAPVLGTIAHVGTGKTTLTGAITSALRAAFTGEKYTANEDLDAAHAENELLHKGLRQAELSMHLIAMAIDEGAPDRAKQTALLYPMTIGAVTARKLAEDRLIHTQP